MSWKTRVSTSGPVKQHTWGSVVRSPAWLESYRHPLWQALLRRPPEGLCDRMGFSEHFTAEFHIFGVGLVPLVGVRVCGDGDKGGLSEMDLVTRVPVSGPTT